MASLAARTRDAVRDRPFLHDGLRAGVINYTAAARYLAVEGEIEAVATALRRYADEFEESPPIGAEARVSMESGVGRVEAGDDDGEDDNGDEEEDDDREEAGDSTGTEPLLTVAGEQFVSGSGSLTAIVTVGDVDPGLLARVLGRLAVAEFDVEAAGMAAGTLVVVVGRRAGVDALRAVESIVEASESNS